jgi:hypothetical protein
MKYVNEIDIELSIEKVIDLFDNPDNMKQWMPGLQSFEHLSGTPGEVGAKSRLKFQMGKRKVEMIETITKKNLPQEFDGVYEAKGVWNATANKFIPLAPGKTRWIAENEFKLRGFMKIIGFLMPGIFKKQSQKYLEYFKAFAEGQKN